MGHEAPPVTLEQKLVDIVLSSHTVLHAHNLVPDAVRAACLMQYDAFIHDPEVEAFVDCHVAGDGGWKVGGGSDQDSRTPSRAREEVGTADTGPGHQHRSVIVGAVASAIMEYMLETNVSQMNVQEKCLSLAQYLDRRDLLP